MKKEFFSTEEIRVIIREAFADEVAEIINTAPEDVHPGNIVAAVGACQSFQAALVGRFGNAQGD